METEECGGVMPWWFYLFPASIPVLFIGLAMLVQHDKKKRGK